MWSIGSLWYSHSQSVFWATLVLWDVQRQTLWDHEIFCGGDACFEIVRKGKGNGGIRQPSGDGDFRID